MARIPRRLDEHTLTERLRLLERRLAAAEARLSAAGFGDPGLVEEPADSSDV